MLHMLAVPPSVVVAPATTVLCVLAGAVVLRVAPVLSSVAVVAAVADAIVTGAVTGAVAFAFAAAVADAVVTGAVTSAVVFVAAADVAAVVGAGAVTGAVVFAAVAATAAVFAVTVAIAAAAAAVFAAAAAIATDAFALALAIAVAAAPLAAPTGAALLRLAMVSVAFGTVAMLVLAGMMPASVRERAAPADCFEYQALKFSSSFVSARFSASFLFLSSNWREPSLAFGGASTGIGFDWTLLPLVPSRRGFLLVVATRGHAVGAFVFGFLWAGDPNSGGLAWRVSPARGRPPRLGTWGWTAVAIICRAAPKQLLASAAFSPAVGFEPFELLMDEGGVLNERRQGEISGALSKRAVSTTLSDNLPAGDVGGAGDGAVACVRRSNRFRSATWLHVAGPFDVSTTCLPISDEGFT